MLIKMDSDVIFVVASLCDQGVDLGTGSMCADEVVMYPLQQKQLYVDPYVQMFFLLN
jgi:hypothetical protein